MNKTLLVPLEILAEICSAIREKRLSLLAYEQMLTIKREAESIREQRYCEIVGCTTVRLSDQLFGELLQAYEGSNQDSDAVRFVEQQVAQAKGCLILPVEITEEIREAFLKGKVLPAYVGSEKVVLAPFEASYAIVLETIQKALGHR